MCTLFANLYVLLTWGPHMVYTGTPYIFDIYMIRCGWLGGCYAATLSYTTQGFLHITVSPQLALFSFGLA